MVKEKEGKLSQEKKKEFKQFLLEISITAVAVILLCRVFFNIIVVDGHSMVPTFQDGAIIITQCHFYDLEQGDIVVCDTDGYDGLIVKRVIAMEGDELDIDYDTGTVSVNGTVLDEPYILEPTHEDLGMEFPVTIQDGCVFVMGDNRNASLDSRSPDIGQISVDDIRGKYLITVFS